MKVKITSPCMAMLVYEAAKCQGQNEGTLCGELTTETVKNITDSDVTITTEEVLSIHTIGALPCLNELNKDETIECSNGKVYGWFKFCRRPVLRLTVHEKSVHRKLEKKLYQQDTTTETTDFSSQVVTILIHERWTENQSLYLWKFAAFVLRERWFIPCPMEIVNLKATTCGVYKPYPTIHQQQRLPQATKALSSLNASFMTNNSNCSFHMVEAVRDTGQEMVRSLEETVGKLRSVESVLESAYSEQEQLKSKLAALQGLKKPNVEESLPLNQYLSDETDTSESSDSAEYYGEEKASELLDDLHQKDGHYIPDDPCSSVDVPRFAPMYRIPAVEHEEPADVIGMNDKILQDSQPPPPYDPFGSLVSIAKADLKKTPDVPQNPPNTPRDEAALLAEYNDELPWADRTRAGRLKTAD
ncbi:uncharacterized protein LOC143449003 [Clavelina lepadiformis]|uniref:Uncharacterized protein n=1 Tax=Clavelina lepadiformis TaxID=159417 RepID=A0ABP0H375_CLALP